VLVPLVEAELRLDAGDAAGAHASASRYLRGLGGGAPIESSAAFELLVPIRIRMRDLDAARRTHERLAAIADDVGSAALRAAERLAAGRIAVAERDAEGARAALEDAVDGYERCVMPYEAEQARDELVRAAAAGQRQSDLTRREAEVLALVADGLSNRQIADRLVVSEHTVHRHVANIFVRLGVSSRAAAVAVAATAGHLGEDGPIG
jgi:DNA-binding NarL/FixJ family response regulator